MTAVTKCLIIRNHRIKPIFDGARGGADAEQVRSTRDLVGGVPEIFRPMRFIFP